MATSKKLNIIATKPPANMPTYSYWGNMAKIAQNQGWYPAVPTNDFTIYRQAYNSPFNDVYIPDTNEKGRIEVIGKKNGKMDIVISDMKGNVRHTVNQDVTPEFVQNWATNNRSTIAQRVNNIQSGKLAAINMNDVAKSF